MQQLKLGVPGPTDAGVPELTYSSTLQTGFRTPSGVRVVVGCMVRVTAADGNLTVVVRSASQYVTPAIVSILGKYLQ